MRVVIVGGGFAAVRFAKTLRKKLRASECELVVFNRENHMVFHPLLALGAVPPVALENADDDRIGRGDRRRKTSRPG